MAIRSILVPLDGSALAEHALPFAEALARALHARLVLLRVARTPAIGAASEGESDAAAYLRMTADPLRSRGLDVETQVYLRYLESVGKAILNFLELRSVEIQELSPRGEVALTPLNAIDMVVMSTHGRSGLDRLVYGSVAAQVVREAEVPVLLVSPRTARQWEGGRVARLLVALDGSELSGAGLDLAADLAARVNAHLLLVWVVDPAHYPDGEADRRAQMAYAHQALEEQAAALRARGLSVAVRVGSGSPSRVLVDTAEQTRSDLIVTTTHGSGGLTRMALGSVTTTLIQRAPVPVLVARPTFGPLRAEEPSLPAEAELTAADTGEVLLPLTRAERELLARGLGELIYAPERDWRQAQAAHVLLRKLLEVDSRAGR